MKENERNRLLGYWLGDIEKLSDRKKISLSGKFQQLEELYNMKEKDVRNLEKLLPKEVEGILEAQKVSLEELAEKQGVEEKKGIHRILYGEPSYPEKLSYISDPPFSLYVKGHLPDPGKLSVSIVGARKCSPYGENMAMTYGEALASVGAQIISGLALGIDGAGQRGALNGGGETFGILGCGADICYPREHIGLYMDIQKQGGIISELPMGTKPLAYNFPRRNRIISGLSDVVLIIEAKEKSGSLITADQALEQGRDVYALPGPVDSPLSRGCHLLIKQGAGILLSPKELIQDLNIQVLPVRKDSEQNKKNLESAENMVYSCVGLFPKNVTELMESTGLEAKELLEILGKLQIRGFIKEISKNYYVRT